MGQRLAWILLLAALVLAAVAFFQQRSAQEEARLALVARAEARDFQVTAAAMVEQSAATRVAAESGQATARAQIGIARTAQANAESTGAAIELGLRATASAVIDLARAVTARATALSATAEAQSEQLSAARVTLTAALSGAQNDLATRSADLAAASAALATATAELDIARFARLSAEEDRATALARAWTASTEVAANRASVATAEAIISGVTPLPTIPRPTATPLPTATPRPTQAAQPVERPPLTGQFVSASGIIAFSYPQGWSVRELESSAIVVANQAAVLDRTVSEVESGQFELTLLVAPAANFRDVPANPSVTDLLTSMVTFLQSQNPGLAFAQADELTLGAYRAARTQAVRGRNDITVTTVDLGNTIAAVAFGSSYQGEMQQFVGAQDDILASLEIRR